jgi:hypothetical protein
MGVGIGVGGARLAMGDIVGVDVAVGMGIIKRTMLRTTIRLRIPKAICWILACDLRELRFTAYLLVG